MHHTYNWRDGSQRMRIRYFDILLVLAQSCRTNFMHLCTLLEWMSALFMTVVE